MTVGTFAEGSPRLPVGKRFGRKCLAAVGEFFLLPGEATGVLNTAR